MDEVSNEEHSEYPTSPVSQWEQNWGERGGKGWGGKWRREGREVEGGGKEGGGGRGVEEEGRGVEGGQGGGGGGCKSS